MSFPIHGYRMENQRLATPKLTKDYSDLRG